MKREQLPAEDWFERVPRTSAGSGLSKPHIAFLVPAGILLGLLAVGVAVLLASGLLHALH